MCHLGRDRALALHRTALVLCCGPCIAWLGHGLPPSAGRSTGWAALTMATIPALSAAGSVGQAASTWARSGSMIGGLAALSTARFSEFSAFLGDFEEVRFLSGIVTQAPATQGLVFLAGIQVIAGRPLQGTPIPMVSGFRFGGVGSGQTKDSEPRQAVPRVFLTCPAPLAARIMPPSLYICLGTLHGSQETCCPC